ncbi:MAG: hypothetical protein LBS50_07360 [Prevotellaceae bacterium]|jgi:hypothetical protein|nr:hypothetical protein [Prevotellaceae bacterium]
MTNRQKYEILCAECPDIPLFMQSWWLDAACIDGEWNVLFYEKNGKIIAVLPYYIRKSYGFKIISQPPLTQYNGIWIDYPENQKLHKRYSFEKKIMDNLIAQLENLKVDYYSQNFHYSFTNWQPFYWKGYKQTTRYTYILKNIADLDAIFENFSYAKQKHIKKNSDLKVDFSLSAENFYEFHTHCLCLKNKKIDYSQKLFLSTYNAAILYERGKIIALKDNENNLHAALFFVWDKNSAYALLSAIHPDFRNDGSSTKIFWEAIKFVADKTQSFDFEGSMIENVAQSFQNFGAEQTPYFNISKSYSKVFSVLKTIKKIYATN